MRSVAIIGNPKLESRTRHAAELVVERLTGSAPADVVELGGLARELVTPGDPDVASAKQLVLESDLLCIASPTYKATYTALLKLFLEQFGAAEIPDVPTIALMLGAGPRHLLSVQHTLVPVLVEIGCSCPAPGLYLLDSDYETSTALETWLARARRTIPTIDGDSAR